MPDATPTYALRERRWWRYQFNLRTLLIVITLLAIPFWYIGKEIRLSIDREAVADRIVTTGEIVEGDRELLGADRFFSAVVRYVIHTMRNDK